MPLFRPDPIAEPRAVEFRNLGGPNFVDVATQAVQGAGQIFEGVRQKEAGDLREGIIALRETSEAQQLQEADIIGAIGQAGQAGELEQVSIFSDQLSELRLGFEQAGTSQQQLIRQGNKLFRTFAQRDPNNVPQLLRVFQEQGFSPKTGFLSSRAGGVNGIDTPGIAFANAITDATAKQIGAIESVRQTLVDKDFAKAEAIVNRAARVKSASEIAANENALRISQGLFDQKDFARNAPIVAEGVALSGATRIQGLVKIALQRQDAGTLTDTDLDDLRFAALGIKQELTQTFISLSGEDKQDLTAAQARENADLLNSQFEKFGVNMILDPRSTLDEFRQFMGFAATVGFENAAPLLGQIANFGRDVLGIEDIAEQKETIVNAVDRGLTALDTISGSMIQFIEDNSLLGEAKLPVGVNDLDTLQKIDSQMRFQAILDKPASAALLQTANLTKGTVRDVFNKKMENLLTDNARATLRQSVVDQNRDALRSVDGTQAAIDRENAQSTANEINTMMQFTQNPGQFIDLAFDDIERNGGQASGAGIVSNLRRGGSNRRIVPSSSADNTPIAAMLGDTMQSFIIDLSSAAAAQEEGFSLNSPAQNEKMILDITVPEIEDFGVLGGRTDYDSDILRPEERLEGRETDLARGDFAFDLERVPSAVRQTLVNVAVGREVTNEDFLALLQDPIAMQVIAEDGSKALFNRFDGLVTKTIMKNMAPALENFSIASIQLGPGDILTGPETGNPNNVGLNIIEVGGVKGMQLGDEFFSQDDLIQLAEDDLIRLSFSSLGITGRPNVFVHSVSPSEIRNGMVKFEAGAVIRGVVPPNFFKAGSIADQIDKLDPEAFDSIANRDFTGTFHILVGGGMPLAIVNPSVDLLNSTPSSLWENVLNDDGSVARRVPKQIILFNGQGVTEGVGAVVTRAVAGDRPLLGITGFSTTGRKENERANATLAFMRALFPDGASYAQYIEDRFRDTTLDRKRTGDPSLKGQAEKGIISLKVSGQKGPVVRRADGSKTSEPRRLSLQGRDQLLNEEAAGADRDKAILDTDGKVRVNGVTVEGIKEGDIVPASKSGPRFDIETAKAADAVSRRIPNSENLSVQQFDQLVQLTFNAGANTSPKAFKLINDALADDEFSQEEIDAISAEYIKGEEGFNIPRRKRELTRFFEGAE